MRWRDQLAEGDGFRRYGPAIRQEANGLRGQLQAWGMQEFADRLGRIEAYAVQSQDGLRTEVHALVATLSYAAPPAGAHGAVAGTVVMAARPEQGGPGAPPQNPSMPGRPSLPQPAPAPQAAPQGAPQTAPRASQAPGAPIPAGSAGPKAASKTFFGLRSFGVGRPPSGSRNALLSEGANESVLNLKSRRPEVSTAPPELPWQPQRSRFGSSSTSSKRARSSQTGSAAKAPARSPTWFYALTGFFALSLLGGGIYTLTHHNKESGGGQASDGGPAITDAGPKDAAPEAASPVEQITALVHQVGAESDQLRALIDTQGSWAEKCLADQSQCGQGYTSKSLWAMRPITASNLGSSSVPAGPPPTWLGKMAVPQDFPLKDSPFVKSAFEFNARAAAGRQRVQGMLFQCSAYEQLFDMTMQKYGAPPWLMAVVFQESACNPHAKSPVGAMGLWQFMPESGRAYGLKVVEDEVDERLNPAKATDAAIHMLSDLAHKFGSWDLALAAYNLGPFALMVRIQQVGGKAGFWDLTDANLLPEETSRYVPAIEAYAIILENRSRLGLTGDGPPLESTAEVIVKPGTRLSLVARAAHTSTNKIRELNPEFLHDDVPEGERSAVVPDSEAHRAQVFLDAPPNDDDECVPDTFDWGKDHFPTSPYAATCHHDK